MADYLVRRDSDGRFGGYVVDLAKNGGPEQFGPDDHRYEAYDDRGRLITQSPLGASPTGRSAGSPTGCLRNSTTFEAEAL